MEKVTLVEIPFDEDVPAANIDQERATLVAILERAEIFAGPVFQISLDDVGPITPWVAKQLGRFSQASSRPLEYSMLAVRAGQLCGHAPTFCDNIISLGNIVQIAGRTREAEDIYRQVLSNSSPECLRQRGIAHLSISQCKEQHGEYRQAGHHMEMALCCLGSTFPAVSKEHLTQKLAQLFAETRNLGGLAHVLFLLNHGNLAVSLADKIQGIELNAVVSAVTTLLTLGNCASADQLRTEWLTLNRSKN